MKLPNFLILGAQKAGTTSLYQYLGQHPQVYMSPIKEPNYFSFGGLTDSQRGVISRRVIEPLSEYQKLFHGAQSEIALGEASPTYLLCERAAGRIRQVVPQAKLIAVLRNPVDRAYSHYAFNRKWLAEKLSFRDAIKAEAARSQTVYRYRFDYLQRGLYYRQLSAYFKLFPKNQICVLLYDDMCKNPAHFLKEVFAFLEVDENFKPNLSVRYNVSGIPRGAITRAIIRTARPLRRWLEANLPAPLLSRAAQSMLRRQTIEVADRAQLAEYFREDISRLEELIQCDLTAWLARN